jgi:hypothetical protein
LGLNEIKLQEVNMTTLLLGASGATGRLLLQELLRRGQQVRVIVRSPDRLPQVLIDNPQVEVVQASVHDLSDAEMLKHVDGCDAVVSCLGHNLSLKGIFGHPRRLVTDATRRVCLAISANRSAMPVKFILMNTAGNSNRDLNESTSFGQKLVIWLLRRLVPPHADNENAADYLRSNVGQNDKFIEWAAVRPDSLTNENSVTEYTVHPSPVRSAIFDPGTTSRINVANFMADLIADDDQWKLWKGQMPVIYNKALSK